MEINPLPRSPTSTPLDSPLAPDIFTFQQINVNSKLASETSRGGHWFDQNTTRSCPEGEELRERLKLENCEWNLGHRNANPEDEIHALRNEIKRSRKKEAITATQIQDLQDAVRQLRHEIQFKSDRQRATATRAQERYAEVEAENRQLRQDLRESKERESFAVSWHQNSCVEIERLRAELDTKIQVINQNMATIERTEYKADDLCNRLEYIRTMPWGTVLLSQPPYPMTTTYKPVWDHTVYINALKEIERLRKAPAQAEIRNLEDQLGLAHLDHKAQSLRARVELSDALQRLHNMTHVASQIYTSLEALRLGGEATPLVLETLENIERLLTCNNLPPQVYIEAEVHRIREQLALVERDISGRVKVDEVLRKLRTDLATTHAANQIKDSQLQHLQVYVDRLHASMAALEARREQHAQALQVHEVKKIKADHLVAYLRAQLAGAGLPIAHRDNGTGGLPSVSQIRNQALDQKVQEQKSEISTLRLRIERVAEANRIKSDANKNLTNQVAKYKLRITAAEKDISLMAKAQVEAQRTSSNTIAGLTKRKQQLEKELSAADVFRQNAAQEFFQASTLESQNKALSARLQAVDLQVGTLTKRLSEQEIRIGGLREQLLDPKRAPPKVRLLLEEQASALSKYEDTILGFRSAFEDIILENTEVAQRERDQKATVASLRKALTEERERKKLVKSNGIQPKANAVQEVDESRKHLQHFLDKERRMHRFWYDWHGAAHDLAFYLLDEHHEYTDIPRQKIAKIFKERIQDPLVCRLLDTWQWSWNDGREGDVGSDFGYDWPQ